MTKLIAYSGTVRKIRILRLGARPLVRFTLITSGAEYSCLVAQHALIFLQDVYEDASLAIWGYFNQRNQLVVRKFAVSGPTYLQLYFDHEKYSFR